ncbi:MAG: hypothetical protein ACXWDO_09935 [Bacteroidia bacterium]
MESIFVDILFSAIGKIWLYVRYRKSIRVKRVLIEEYEGSFIYAGKIALIWLFNIVFYLALFVLLLAVLFNFILDS